MSDSESGHDVDDSDAEAPTQSLFSEPPLDSLVVGGGLRLHWEDAPKLDPTWTELHHIAGQGFVDSFDKWWHKVSQKAGWIKLFAARDSINELTPLLVAIDCVHLRSMEGYGCQLASYQERTLLISKMLQYGANANDPIRFNANKPNLTPLINAVIAPYIEVIPLLVQYGANTEYYWNGQTALHVATDELSEEGIYELVKCKADINAKTKSYSGLTAKFGGGTALHIIAALRQTRNDNGEGPIPIAWLTPCLIALLQSGIDIHAINLNGVTALTLMEHELVGSVFWWKRKSFVELIDISGLLVGEEHIVKYLFNVDIAKEISSYM